jgi:peptide/nickel transport system substrate-binding protein
MAAFLNYLGDPASFTAPNPTTFVWKMKTPTLSPLTPPYVPILPEHIWAKLDGKDAKTIKEFEPVPQVGSGPFQLTGWKEGQYVIMKANPDYWGGAPHMDEVIFKTYDTPEALALALQTGEVDFADSLTPNLFDKLKSTPNVATNIAAPATFDNLAFNFEGTANPALKNEQVRLAISYAIDRQTLVDRVWLGYASVGNSVVMPTYKRWYQAPAAGTVQNFDPAKAKQLLDAAGYTDSNGDGIREMPDGSPFTLQILAISDFDQSVAESNLIAGWLKNIGIDASVKTVNTAKAYDLWGSQNFDAYVWGWTGDPDPDFILSIFTTKQCLEWSDGCYSDPAYDTMYQQQHSATDINARTAEVQKMEQYLYEKNPEIVLLYEQDLQAYRTDRWTGYIVQPQPQGFLLFQWGTYSYLNIRPVEQGAGVASSGSGGGASSGGLPAYLWIILAIVAILGALFFVRRARKSEENVE